jgi:hypothetical protein
LKYRKEFFDRPLHNSNIDLLYSLRVPDSTENVIVRLRGGLGNQLYGFTAGWVLAKTTGRNLIGDGRYIPWEGSNPFRRLELEKFEWAPNTDFKVTFRKSFISGSKVIFFRKLFTLSIELFVSKKRLASQSVGEDIGSLLKLQNLVLNGKDVKGYFQSFDWGELAIKLGMPKNLNLKHASHNVIAMNSKLENYVAVHIRLTDFLEFPDSFFLPSENYYLEGIRSFRETNGIRNYCIFTDDKHEAKRRYPRVFTGENLILDSSNFDPTETLFLMSKCKAIITADSTFSYWAAFFIGINGGRVICPIFAKLKNGTDHRPKYWSRLDADGDAN